MKKRLLSLVIVSVLVLTFFAGCADSGSGKALVVTMPSYRTGANAGAKFFEPQVARFNAKYSGKYEIKLESTDDATHVDKIKGLAQQDKLPVIFQVPDSAWVKSYLIANKKLQDLSAFIDGKPDMKKLLIQTSVDYCTEDGGIYAMPLTVLRSTGLYYNNALFSPSKALTEMTWAEFNTELGENKIAYQTAEGGWTVTLMLAAILGGIDGGIELLEAGVEEKITDFNKPQFLEAFGILQESFKNNGWDGAVGVPYAAAANTFYASQTAVLPDGTWIIEMINNPDESSGGFKSENIVGDFFPGNVAIANPSVYDWMVSATATDAEKKLAYAFLEFMNTPEEIEGFILAEGGAAVNLDYSANFKTKISENKLLNDFATKANSDTKYIPFFHDAITQSLYTGEFTNLMVDLYLQRKTPEQFCIDLTKAAQE